MKPERSIWLKEAEIMVIDDGKTWEQAAKELNEKYGDGEFTRPIVRNTVRRHSERWEKGERSTHGDRPATGPVEREEKPSGFKESEKVNQDGSRESFKLLEMIVGKKYTPDELLVLHGFDPPENWELIDCTSNAWNGMTGKKRNNELVELRQSKLRAKPRKAALTVADIDTYMENKVFKYDKPLTEPFQYDPNGEVLEIDLPDFHGGLLAWIQETGADYDIHIAKDLFFKCLYDIIERCNGRKFKKIMFATLGDLCHIDNDQQTTTKGTFQQADGRISKISDAIMDMLIDGITLLAGIAPVHVIYLPGNHDRVTGRMLMMCVCQAFRSDPNVTFDMTPNPMKHIEIGINLIGLCHGDMIVKNMDKWLQVHAREAWGRCKHIEVHQGHIHSEKQEECATITVKNKVIDEVGGVLIKTLPTICNASYWEHQMGYTSGVKAVVCFIWNEKTGLRDTWYSCV